MDKNNNNNNVFQKILLGELPSYKIYEDNLFYAFLDITPVTKGHTIVIPKKFYLDMLEASDEINEKIFAFACSLSKKIIKALNADGCNILTNAKEAAGQSVFYYHIHIIPRYNDQKGLIFNIENNNQEAKTDNLFKIKTIITKKIQRNSN